MSTDANREHIVASLHTTVQPKSVAGPVLGAVALSLVTAWFLLGLGFGRGTACTSSLDPDCGALSWLLITAHLANVAIGIGAVVALVRGGKTSVVLPAQLVLLVVLFIAAILLSAPGVLWG